MVKVLENKIIDLDLLPGQTQIDAQRAVRAQLQQAKGAVTSDTSNPDDLAAQIQQAGGVKDETGAVQIPQELLPNTMNEEQKANARGVAATILDGSGNVIGGLAGTVGGVLKGVGDTAGNTVYALGSGLGQTGVGAASGLADTAKAPFVGANQSKSEPQVLPILEGQEEGSEEKKKKGPRKIEVRSGKEADEI